MIDKKKRMDVWTMLSLVILALYGLFLIYPLIRLLVESVSKEGHFTMEYFGKFFSNSYSLLSNSDSTSDLLILMSR